MGDSSGHTRPPRGLLGRLVVPGQDGGVELVPGDRSLEALLLVHIPQVIMAV